MSCSEAVLDCIEDESWPLLRQFDELNMARAADERYLDLSPSEVSRSNVGTRKKKDFTMRGVVT